MCIQNDTENVVKFMFFFISQYILHKTDCAALFQTKDWQWGKTALEHCREKWQPCKLAVSARLKSAYDVTRDSAVKSGVAGFRTSAQVIVHVLSLAPATKKQLELKLSHLVALVETGKFSERCK